MHTPDREINPPSFYEKEIETSFDSVNCELCNESILIEDINEIIHKMQLKQCCDYCKEQVLKNLI